MTDLITQPLTDSSDAGVNDEPLTRREALTKGASLASSVVTAVAIGSIPLALGAFVRTARAQTTAPTTARGVLEFVYLLENLESEFYKAVLGTSAIAAHNTAFAPVRAQVQTNPQLLGSVQQIAKHEAAHVEFLKAQITALGGAAVTYTGAEFDFTGGNAGAMRGPFSEARTDLATMLVLAQILEDTGVRAYKGQLDKLIGTPAVLTAVLKIHSVEGRHAARIRLLRNVTGLKPWISSSATSTTTGITVTGAGTASNVSIYVIPGGGYARTSGSFATEGFATGQAITAGGFTNAANNGSAVVSGVTAPTTGSTSLSATATGYARAAGSFITNGFVVGQQVTASGFATAANNGRSTITAVTATTLTVTKDTPTVAEAAATGRTIVGDSRLAVATRTPALVAEPAATGRFLVTQIGITTAGSTMITRAYAGETNSIQSGLDMAGLGSNTGGVTGVNEAFDEALTYDQVIAIIQDFVIGTTP